MIRIRYIAGDSAREIVLNWAAMYDEWAGNVSDSRQKRACAREAKWAWELLKDGNFNASLVPALTKAEETQPGVTWRFIEAALTTPRDGKEVAQNEAQRAEMYTELVASLAGGLSDKLMLFGPPL